MPRDDRTPSTIQDELVTSASRAWFERARAVLAGGISSSARATVTGPHPYPLYIVRGRDAHIWDADGNEYVDYLLSYGSAILGHADPALEAALGRVLAEGTMFGTCSIPEVLLAEQICRMVPCADLVRYANSGSEAIQGTVRAARGFTGRSKLLKFEGHYHGWADVLAVSNRPGVDDAGPYDAPASQPHSPGIPRGVTDDVVICPWNDEVVLRAILDRHPDEFAAVICEPIVANCACTMPQPGYLETLRDECTRRGIVLIFDEICTGFRTAPGGAQELFGVVPDLAAYSKALGGGLPIAAFAGRREIMERVASNEVKHGGTYNGSPLCATAASVVLAELAKPAVTERIDECGRRAIEAIRRASRVHGVPAAVQGVGAMFQVVFSAGGRPTRQYRDLFELDAARYGAFRWLLLEAGIHVNGAASACWFVSPSLTDDDVERTCLAIDAAFRALAL
jgi:glutamate-1-semialdehyde 2,1-aminomutase